MNPAPLAEVRCPYLTLVLSEVAAVLADSDSAAAEARTYGPRIQQALQWMEQNLHQALAIDALAAQCGAKADAIPPFISRTNGPLSGRVPDAFACSSRAGVTARASIPKVTEIAHQLGFTTS